MSVANKQAAIAKTFNDAFLSKTTDSETVAKLTLSRTESGDAIDDVQQEINNLKQSSSSNTTTLDIKAKTLKETPLSDDILLIEDSEDSFNKKKIKLESLLGGGGAGSGGSTAWIESDISPVKDVESGLEIYKFDNESGHELYLNAVVPLGFVQGTQINLKNVLFYISSIVGNVLLKCETTLIKNGETYSNISNQHTSTNTEIDLSVLSSNELISISSIDLTDALGKINSIDVVEGDLLKIKLYRDFENETSSSSEDVKFLKYSASVSFS